MANTDVKRINHDLRCYDGATIQMPKWSAANVDTQWGRLSLPDVYAAAASVATHPVGTVYREDKRTFVYGLYSATTTLKTAGYAVCTVATYKDLANSVIAGAADASTVQINYGGACAVNKYAGGFLGIKGATYRSCHIESNTVQDASNYVTFTVDGTWPTACLTTDDVVLMEDPYREMRWYITLPTRPYIGCTCSTIVVSKYVWIQTWGPYMMGSAYNTWEGADGNQFGVYIHHGSFQALPSNTSGAVHGSIIQVGGDPLAGYFACGCDPSSPADVSIAYPIWLMIRP